MLHSISKDNLKCGGTHKTHLVLILAFSFQKKYKHFLKHIFMHIHIFSGTAKRQETVFSQVNNKIIFQNFVRFKYLSNSYNSCKNNEDMKKKEVQFIYLLGCNCLLRDT